MAFMTLFNGVMPVVGSILSKEILNSLSRAYAGELTTFHIIAVLLIAQFAYQLFNDAVGRVYSTVLQISGELVANHTLAITSTVINFYFRRKNFNYMFRRSKDRRQLKYYSELVTNKDLVKEMRTLNLTDIFIRKYQSVFDTYFKGLKRLKLHECVWNLAISVLSTVVNCVLFVLIAQGVFEGRYEVGNYALYTGALNAISRGISSLITTTASIYESTLFINNMISFMKEEPRIVPSINPPRKVTRGVGHTIVFDHVSFRYPGT